MLSIPGQWIGDPWFFIDGARAHCFFLTASSDNPPAARHMNWDIGHAVSGDLRSWTYEGIVLRAGPGDWDGHHLATGSIIRYKDRFWMAYTGHPRNEESTIQRVGLAVSDDLHVWEKHAGNPVTEVDERYYERTTSGQRPFMHWRDPAMFTADGAVYHVVCARKHDGDTASRGSVGVARTSDMISWEVLPPLEIEPFAEELECPSIIMLSGRWYLIFSTHRHLIAPAWRSKISERDLRSGTYAMVSDSPFGPYRFCGMIERSPSPVYAGQIVAWKGGIYLMGTCSDKKDTVSDPIPVEADENGIHTRPAGEHR
ncbi:MAG: hypothetical protein AABZ39_08080 [Spirochaetota bacterium]